jgi:hypothetical protein
VDPKRWPVFVFVTTLAADIALLVKLMISQDPSSSLIAAVVILTVVIILVPRIPDIARLKVFGMSAQLRTVKQGLAETKKEVQVAQENVVKTNERLDGLFALSLSDWQFVNLQKLASGNFGQFVRSLGLENDLRHLRNHGYIEAASVRDVPNSGEELCDYVRVTNAGRSFLRFRESLALSTPRPIVQENRLKPADHPHVARDAGQPSADRRSDQH